MVTRVLVRRRKESQRRRQDGRSRAWSDAATGQGVWPAFVGWGRQECILPRASRGNALGQNFSLVKTILDF